MSITEQFLKFALLGAEWVMYLLIFCSILSISIIIERVIYLSRFRGDFGRFIEGLTTRLNSDETPETVAAWCSGQNMIEAKVAAEGLSRASSSVQSVDDAMTATMIAARNKLDRGLIVLGTLGNNTPFIGLFGTIIGIIEAFHALATNKGAGPELVMSSISEALVATAFGIIVAVPAVMSYNILLRSIKKRMANSETTAHIILTHLGKSKNP